MLDALDLRELLANELVERRESGYELDGLGTEVEAALVDPLTPSEKVQHLYDELDQTHLRSGWAYEEPSQFDEIVERLARRRGRGPGRRRPAAGPRPRRLARALCRVQPGQAGRRWLGPGKVAPLSRTGGRLPAD